VLLVENRAHENPLHKSALGDHIDIKLMVTVIADHDENEYLATDSFHCHGM